MKHNPNKRFAAIATIMDGTSRITFEAYGDTAEQARQEFDALTTKYRHAPELLEALERIVSDLPTNRDWLDPQLERIARAAIAKAKGTT